MKIHLSVSTMYIFVAVSVTSSTLSSSFLFNSIGPHFPIYLPFLLSDIIQILLLSAMDKKKKIEYLGLLCCEVRPVRGFYINTVTLLANFYIKRKKEKKKH